MEDQWYPKTQNIPFNEEDGTGVLLSYNWSQEGNPSIMLIYFGNEKYHETMLNFETNYHGKENIENCWRGFMELQEKKELTLDSVCSKIENILITEDAAKIAKKVREIEGAK